MAPYAVGQDIGRTGHVTCAPVAQTVLQPVRNTTEKDESQRRPAADTPVDAPAATAPPARSESPDPAEEGQESPAPLPSPEESAGQKAPPQTENH